MKNKTKKKTLVKEFECKPECDFLKIEGVVFYCDECMKHTMINLTNTQKERIYNEIMK